jgi:hypothetical protein
MVKEKLLRNKKVLSIAAIVLAAIALVAGAIALALANRGGAKAYTGYLICQNCGLKGKCEMNNVDLTAQPEKYTLKCARMTDCILSGYGIAVKQENGQYRYYPFDAAGSALALSDVVYSTKRPDNLLVEVKGKLEDGIMRIESIAEK